MAHLLQRPAAATALPAITTAARSTQNYNWRLELFFKSHEELQRQLPFLQKHGIRKVNLTNKIDKDDLLASVKLLQAAIPDLDVCVHYSIKYNYDRTPSGHLEKGASARSRKRPAASGVRPNTSVGSSGSQLPSLAVAFNPYLPDERDAQVERTRLREKLATGLVDRIYLQMGTDLHCLSSGLQYLQQLTQEGLCEPPQLLGSLFLPSKRLLAQMKFRPWNGVFLSDEYLSSVEAAEAITKNLLSVYSDAGVVPLVESAVTTDSDMLRLQALLGSNNAQQLSADAGPESA
eukprot:gene12875-13001_t